MHRLPWKFEEGDGTNRRRDIENVNDDRDNEGENKASPSLQTLLLMTVNATLSPLRRRPGRHCVTKKFKDAVVRLVDSSSSRLEIYQDADNEDGHAEDQNDDGDDNEDDDMTNMSKCMQLVGGGGGGGASEQLYGCNDVYFG